MILKLKEDRIKAMKEKDNVAKSILNVLYSDSLVLAKKETRDVTESDIVQSAKTLIKRNEQTIKLIKDMDKSVTLIEEVTILKGFLPVQITEEEIKLTVCDIIKNWSEDELIRKNQGKIMKELKEKYGDTINMCIAFKYVSSKLK